jgi:hypothetical protein
VEQWLPPTLQVNVPDQSQSRDHRSPRSGGEVSRDPPVGKRIARAHGAGSGTTARHLDLEGAQGPPTEAAERSHAAGASAAPNRERRRRGGHVQEGKVPALPPLFAETRIASPVQS